MNQLTNCQTGIKAKSILNMLKIELVTRTCTTWSFLGWAKTYSGHRLL